MKAIFGGLIAMILLGLYAYSVLVGVDAANCLAISGCTKFTAASFTDGMSGVMSLVGGLVSALVISELSITQPGDQPLGRAITDDPTALSSQFIKYTTLFYLLVWLAIGLWAFVVGVMQHPKIIQPLTDLGQAWLGLAVAAAYAYFGITPK